MFPVLDPGCLPSVRYVIDLYFFNILRMCFHKQDEVLHHLNIECFKQVPKIETIMFHTIDRKLPHQTLLANRRHRTVA